MIEPSSDLDRKLTDMGTRRVVPFDISCDDAPAVMFIFHGAAILIIPMRSPASDATEVEWCCFSRSGTEVLRTSFAVDLETTPSPDWLT